MWLQLWTVNFSHTRNASCRYGPSCLARSHAFKGLSSAQHRSLLLSCCHRASFALCLFNIPRPRSRPSSQSAVNGSSATEQCTKRRLLYLASLVLDQSIPAFSRLSTLFSFRQLPFMPSALGSHQLLDLSCLYESHWFPMNCGLDAVLSSPTSQARGSDRSRSCFCRSLLCSFSEIVSECTLCLILDLSLLFWITTCTGQLKLPFQEMKHSGRH